MSSFLLLIAVASGIILIPEASQINLIWWQKILGLLLVSGESFLRTTCFSRRGAWLVYLVAVSLGGAVLSTVLPVLLIVCWMTFIISCGRIVHSQADEEFANKLELYGTWLIQIMIVLTL